MDDMEELTPEQVQAYLENPHKCPWCHGEMRIAPSVAANHVYLTINMECLSTGRQWTNIYKLVGFTEGGKCYNVKEEVLETFNQGT